MLIFTAIEASDSAARSNRSYSKADGFTLVELLVVVFLIGLAATAVVLSLPGTQSVLRDDAERMAARIAAARDQAVLESTPTAIWFRASGYGFEQRRAGQWQPVSGKSFEQINWTNGTQIAAVSGGVVANQAGKATGSAASSQVPRQGRLLFDQTGLPSAPVSLTMRNNGAALALNVSASGDVSIAP